ncbi:acyl-[acyl-carrier-protein] desaturase 7, chloroplastic-like [Triticum urartu]|uniref:acyl-[acyl-carrier-protein] desaturase 7, chloroplastic-like n=1 Tax=Triticum urartu TaxID=4572 RepID=UPI0020438ED1|nr:acyl-[acyl-carrier-protein] desaturase 7, chloroplastic-like [Triticum urartu]XP_048554437.1 acyl-[acyl-carrier-protein] desaturase 7, chloroplastic-like [Triticum urartu]
MATSWLLRHPCPLARPWTRTRNDIGLHVTSITYCYWRCTKASGGGRIMADMSMHTTSCKAEPALLPQADAAELAGGADPPPRASKRSARTGRAATVAARHDEEGTDDEWLMYLEPAKLEVFDHLEPWAEANVVPLLKPAQVAWQPTDLLPDPASLGADGFHAACSDISARAAGLPDAHLVCLVGNMVTEEALPTYQSIPNRFEAVRDLTGSSGTAWARWIRGWSAEENRHGDVLNRYLFLSGRVDMRQVERTIHNLIQSGMVMNAARSPYHGFIYVAFQERATSISHGNTARHAKEHGDLVLARICGAIAADEKRHELAYTRIVGKLFEIDPDGAVRALAYMMRRRIVMPASLMTDGRDGDLFAHYAAVAQQTGIYTASDYRSILEHLMKQWGVEELAAAELSDDGRRAREYVCALPHKIRRLEEKAHERSGQKAQPATSAPFSWIFDKPLNNSMG